MSEIRPAGTARRTGWAARVNRAQRTARPEVSGAIPRIAAPTAATGSHIVTPRRFRTIGRLRLAKAAGKTP